MLKDVLEPLSMLVNGVEMYQDLKSDEAMRKVVESGEATLGIELGSTRIKAVLVDSCARVIAMGMHSWESHFDNGIWTYSLNDVRQGLQFAYMDLARQVQESLGVPLKNLASLGISAMMHGYLVFDSENNLLVPFRTWRNTNTATAADTLTELFHENIPQRWSIAHLYQAIMDEEGHVKNISYMTTLSGYVHWLLSGQKVLGVGDAVGMFPIDTETNNYDESAVKKFDALVAGKGFSWKLRDILPSVLVAGNEAGMLSESGACLLDPSGVLSAGVPMCPPEGDAGTGMVATNSIRPRTGNVSAGTSIFAMIVLEKALSKVYREVDVVTTPDGSPVAMVHTNNGTGELDAWIALIREAASLLRSPIDESEIYPLLYASVADSAPDAGGITVNNYLSGEHITGVSVGTPLYFRSASSELTLGNLIRAHFYAMFATLSMGLDLLRSEEKIVIDYFVGHGGIFKTPLVAQKMLGTALQAPISVRQNAGEGGAWGIAVLALYLHNNTPSLPDFVDSLFDSDNTDTQAPTQRDIEGFHQFLERFKMSLMLEKKLSRDG